jgi:predicted RNase H-like HicB family nuclease
VNPLEYAVVIERQGHSYGAHVPDLPGCAVVGQSRREVQANIRKAIRIYIDDMIADGESIPVPATSVIWVARPARKARAR